VIWRVVRVNDDGRREVVNGGMCALAAEKVAGALRDASTEVEIRDGWNYQAVNGTEPISKEQGPDSGLCFTSLRLFDARWRTGPSKNIDGGEAQSGSLKPRNTEQKAQGRSAGNRAGGTSGAIGTAWRGGAHDSGTPQAHSDLQRSNRVVARSLPATRRRQSNAY
jgi:hypothetical protein